MAGYKAMLRDEQWKKIEPLLPEFPRSPKGGPKPRDNRDCFEGILWVLRSGARWKDLPRTYPSASTCWRRLRDWEECDVWLTLWRTFLSELDEQGRLNWEQVFADGSFAPAKRGLGVGKTKRGKGTKWMVVADGQGIPLGIRLTSASPVEVTLLEPTLENVCMPRIGGDPRRKPQRIIADKAYDSDGLRAD